MKLPAVLFTELAEKHGVSLPGLSEDEFISGLRMQDSSPEPGYLYLASSLPAGFVNEALALAARVLQWLTSLDICVRKEAAPQELLDLSLPILDEPVMLVDPSMKRIAAADCIPVQDVFFTEVTSQGYPTLDTYARLESGHFYDPKYYSGRVVCLRTNEEPCHDVALRGIRLRGKLAATALMISRNGPMSKSRLALFSLLTDRFAQSLESPWIQADERSEQYDFLLRELLDGKTLSPEEIAARLRFTQRADPCPGHVVLFSAVNITAAKLGYICRILDSVFPGTRPLICDDCVMTLLPMRPNERKTALDELHSFCVNADCSCGVSSPIPALGLLREAFSQAHDALTLGRALSMSDSWYAKGRTDTAAARVFSHDDFSAFRAIRAFTQQHDPIGLCRQEFMFLQRQDTENGTDNLRVLYYFLNSHMNYTEAARRLYMHRNSVFYRIDRICQSLGVTEIDPDLERGLLFSYMVQDIIHLSEISPKID